MTPTFSLGCGTWGGSLTTDNVNYRNLLNVKAVSHRQAPPQWFRVPSDTYFNAGALENLRQLHARQVLVVTDAGLRGARRRRRRAALPRRRRACTCSPTIGPEPPEEQVRAGVEVLERFEPDTILAVGGGSVLDAAKAMRLFHESPELKLRELSLPFLDARKRVAHYPEIDHSVRLVAIPTTAGTGSEVSPAAVLTVGDRKVTLVDYSLVPDMAIVEPRLTVTMPPHVTADTGVDALTHALEAAVSIFASPYTDAFAMQAVNLILRNLPRAHAEGSDLEARTAMANAATIAGLAFSNAFVGVCHALAHAVGGRFGVAHGRANGIFLPHVLRYNAVAAEQVHAGTRLHRLRRSRTSTPRSRTCSGSAAAAARSGARGCSSAWTSCWTRSGSRARWRRRACRGTSSRRRCRTWRAPRSWTRACAPIRGSRW